VSLCINELLIGNTKVFSHPRGLIIADRVQCGNCKKCSYETVK
jgi:hypothetical protein